MTAIWLVVEMKYWITKTARIAAIAYPRLKRVLLFMIELRAHTLTGSRIGAFRLIQERPWRDLVRPPDNGNREVWFQWRTACATNRATWTMHDDALVRQQVSERPETFGELARLVTRMAQPAETPAPAFAPCW